MYGASAVRLSVQGSIPLPAHHLGPGLRQAGVVSGLLTRGLGFDSPLVLQFFGDNEMSFSDQVRKILDEPREPKHGCLGLFICILIIPVLLIL